MRKIIMLISFILFVYTKMYSQNIETIGTYSFDDSSKLNSKVYKIISDSVVFFKADFDLDADGSPRAYNPSNTGILHNDNGRHPVTKKWFAIVVENNIPVLQDNSCPYPGYYISTTSLELKNYKTRDYNRYINSDSIPYFVLPGGQHQEYRKMSMKLGDIALIYNINNKRYAYAIFADIGPGKIIGEGSIKLANELGIKTYIDKKGRIRGGEENESILYILFPKSGYSKYEYLDSTLINKLGNNAFKSKDNIQLYVEKLLKYLKNYTNGK